jgi:hypothetical protein
MSKADRRPRAAGVLAAVSLLLVFATAAALDSPEADWFTVDGGGASVTAGDLTLAGTIGQPDAGLLTGGAYSLGGGFWGGGALVADYAIYLPLVMRSS